MDAKQWIVENWQTILSWTLTFIAYFLCFIDFLKVMKTRTSMSVLFKENTQSMKTASSAMEKRVLSSCDEVKALGNALLSESKALSEYSKAIVEKERKRMQEQIEMLKREHDAELQKYRESLLEITQADKTLVAKGVAEKVARRFIKKESLAETTGDSDIKVQQTEETSHADK